jgi:two-component system chemotaxis sensor kinase CheA
MGDIRELFALEAEQRLSRLGQLVLDLEPKSDDDKEVIGEIFREVHTLKGSAAVVGFETIGRYAHDVEGRLEQLRSGATVTNAVIVDALLIAIDRLGIMIRGAVSGDDLDGDDPEAATALARLDSAFETPTTSVPSPEPVEIPQWQPLSGEATPSRSPGRASGERDGGTTVMVPIDRLDELVRMVGEAATGLLRVGRVLTERLGVQPDDLAEFSELTRLLNGLQERAMSTLMVPVATVTDQLQRAVRDTARSLGKDVRWEVRGESTELDRNDLRKLADALLHLVRNAVDHGIEGPEERAAAGKPTQAVVQLHAMQLGSDVIIAITDDGGGIDVRLVRERASRMGIDPTSLTDEEALQLVFYSGLSTSTFVSDISGRGVGLDVVHASVEAARGRVEVRTTVGAGSEFRIVVPITLAVLDCLLVETAGQRFALPLHRIAFAQEAESARALHMEGRRAILVDAKPVPVSDLAQLIDVPETAGGAGTLVVINGNTGRHAFGVDALVGRRGVVVKAMSPLVTGLDFVAGTSVEPDGSILLVLDPLALIERARRNGDRSISTASDAAALVRSRGRVLVVDDALTVRELQRAILERAGFEVRVARDGVEALELLEAETPDLVLTDVEMPRMDGFELTEEIRRRPDLRSVPVLILTSRATDADRQRGLDAGADGYIVKSAFDEQSLLAAVDRIVGPAS